MTTRVFHYTVAAVLPDIADAGNLRGMEARLEPRERPIVWFSAATMWEPTATKPLVKRTPAGPTLFKPSVDQLHTLVGLVRFAAPASDKRLVPWPRLAEAARIPPRVRAHLASSGIALGARPTDWWGALNPIRVEDLEFEAFDGSSWSTASFTNTVQAARTRFAGVRRLALSRTSDGNNLSLRPVLV